MEIADNMFYNAQSLYKCCKTSSVL